MIVIEAQNRSIYVSTAEFLPSAFSSLVSKCSSLFLLFGAPLLIVNEAANSSSVVVNGYGTTTSLVNAAGSAR